MSIPTLYTHYKEDKLKTNARYKFDLALSLLAIICIGIFAIFSITDILKTSYEGVCSSNVTAKVLCDDWSFRQCSYFGDNIGTKPNANNALPQNQPSKEQCQIAGDGDCPVFDTTSPNFCTNYKGGKMDGDGKLFSYLWQGNVNQETVQFNGEAEDGMYMCCGQIERTMGQKLIIWLGIVGGTASIIFTLISLFPVDKFVKVPTEVKPEGLEIA